MPRGVPRDEMGQGTVNVCCPPIAKESFKPMFRIHQLPGKGIADTYGVTFQPTAALDTQMKAFAPFAGLFTPNGWLAHSVLLDSEMKELTQPSTWTPTLSNVGPAFAAGAPVYSHALRGWWTVPGSGVWDGPHNDFGNHKWEFTYEDGKHVSPNFMKPNKWYVIKLTLKLASKDRPGDQSWHVTPISCMTKYVAVMVENAGLRMSPGAGAPTIGKIVDIN